MNGDEWEIRKKSREKKNGDEPEWNKRRKVEKKSGREPHQRVRERRMAREDKKRDEGM